MSIRGSSWGGRRPDRSAPTWRWTRWRWPSGPAAGHAWTASSTTRIAGCNLAIRYTERLADAGVAASVGSRGDSYDNALAESFNGCYKTEVIRHHGPWRGLDDVEYATLEYVDWFNQRRLHGEIGMIPPADFEVIYYHQGTPALLAVSQ